MKAQNEMNKGSERIPYKAPFLKLCTIDYLTSILGVSYGEETEMEDVYDF